MRRNGLTEGGHNEKVTINERRERMEEGDKWLRERDRGEWRHRSV